jgi:glycosyltransferase involved in cell wall biosynthesis
VATEKLRVVRPGVSIPQAPVSDADFRAAHGLAPADRVLMTVGHFDAPERFRDGVGAFDNLRGIDPSLHLFLIGDGAYRQRLVDMSQFAARPELGIHFLGTRSDAPALLSQADIVLVAHRRTGGTYAVLEALAAGRPVVASRLPHLAELIRDGETGLLVAPGNISALVRSTMRLLNDEKLCQTMGAAARCAAETYFSAARMATDFAELYDEILNR